MIYGNRAWVASIRWRPSVFCARSSRPQSSARPSPETAAHRLVDGGFTPKYDYALQTMTELPYDRWREYDSEDTMRFYALRLHEAACRSSPNTLLAEGTDWRFVNELKRELKA